MKQELDATSIKLSQHIKANRTNSDKKIREILRVRVEKFEILKMQSKIASIFEKCYHFCGAVLRYINNSFLEILSKIITCILRMHMTR